MSGPVVAGEPVGAVVGPGRPRVAKPARGGGLAGWTACLGVACLLSVGGWHAPALQAHPAGTAGAVLSMAWIAAPAVWSTVRWLGAGRGLGLLLVLAVYAFGVETTGLLAGVPYGRFHYVGGMGPLVAGLVPVSLPLGYVPLVLAAMTVARRRSLPRLPAWLVGAVVLVACDLVLDPGAVALGYWVYDGGGALYGVPWTNFAGWLLTGAGAVALGGRLTAGAGSPSGAVLTSAIWVMSFWTGVAAGLGLAVPAVVGVGLVVALLAGALRWSGAGRVGDG